MIRNLLITFIQLILFLSPSHSHRQQEPIFLTEDCTPINVFFLPSETYIDCADRYIIYKPDQDEIDMLFKKENYIIGFERTVLNCNWVNFQITEPDQIATELSIIQNEIIVSEVSTSLTVKPIRCLSKEVWLVDNYPNNIERIYVWDVVKNIIRESNKEPKFFKSVDHPKYKFVYKGERNRQILIDYDGGVWFSNKRNSLTQT